MTKVAQIFEEEKRQAVTQVVQIFQEEKRQAVEQAIQKYEKEKRQAVEQATQKYEREKRQAVEKTTQEVVLRMLKKDYPPEEISQLVNGYSVGDIEALRKEMQI